jgi:hypothetical protein
VRGVAAVDGSDEQIEHPARPVEQDQLVEEPENFAALVM